MCKDHDEQHYPREIREAAMIIACGNAMDRDMLLRAAVHDGMCNLIDQEFECMATVDAEAVLRLMKRHWRNHMAAVTKLKERLHERWDDRLDQLIEEMQANQVD